MSLDFWRRKIAANRDTVAVVNTATGEARMFMAPKPYYQNTAEPSGTIVAATIDVATQTARIDPPIDLSTRLAQLSRGIAALTGSPTTEKKPCKCQARQSRRTPMRPSMDPVKAVATNLGLHL
jgi:hypothetical protein